MDRNIDWATNALQFHFRPRHISPLASVVQLSIIKRLLAVHFKTQAFPYFCFQFSCIFLKLFAKCDMGDKIKDGEMGEACSSHGNMKMSYEILVGKYCNEFVGSLFKMEVYYTPKFDTQLLITIHNSSRLLTQV
jgi:hypothetical protein